MLELPGSELQVVERLDVLFNLFDTAGTDEGTGHPRIPQHPEEGQLRKLHRPRSAPVLFSARTLAERRSLTSCFLRKPCGLLARESAGIARCRYRVGEQSLRQRAEGDAADAFLAEHVEQAILHRVENIEYLGW